MTLLPETLPETLKQDHQQEDELILCRYYSYSYWYILNKSNFITYKLDVKCLDCRKWKSGQCTIADFGLKTCVDSLMLVVKQYFLIYTHLFEILTFKTSLYNKSRWQKVSVWGPYFICVKEFDYLILKFNWFHHQNQQEHESLLLQLWVSYSVESV